MVPSRKAALIFVMSLTLARVPLVFLFVAAAVAQAWHPAAGLAAAALALLVLASITDLFDGFFARRWNVTTRLGMLLDPLMDKVFYLSVLPTLLYLIARHAGWETHAVVMLAFTVFFLLRDQWVSFLRGVGAEHGADMRANWAGKLRTALAFPIACAIYLYVAFTPAFLPLAAVYALEALGIAINLVSIVVYTRRLAPYLRRVR